jgi:hypothetical protein
MRPRNARTLESSPLAARPPRPRTGPQSACPRRPAAFRRRGAPPRIAGHPQVLRTGTRHLGAALRGPAGQDGPILSDPGRTVDQTRERKEPHHQSGSFRPETGRPRSRIGHCPGTAQRSPGRRPQHQNGPGQTLNCSHHPRGGYQGPDGQRSRPCRPRGHPDVLGQNPRRTRPAPPRTADAKPRNGSRRPSPPGPSQTGLNQHGSKQHGRNRSPHDCCRRAPNQYGPRQRCPNQHHGVRRTSPCSHRTFRHTAAHPDPNRWHGPSQHGPNRHRGQQHRGGRRSGALPRPMSRHTAAHPRRYRSREPSQYRRRRRGSRWRRCRLRRPNGVRPHWDGPHWDGRWSRPCPIGR